MLLLLPQGEAFHALQQRLRCVPPPGLLGRSTSAAGPAAPSPHLDSAALAQEFVQIRLRRLPQV
jgi:hypothetical protein